jgi:hypothetical protein
MSEVAEAGADRRLDWDEAEERSMVAGGSRLTVRGTAPVPMAVRLEPGPIPINPDDANRDYRSVLVIGRPSAIDPQVETPWDVSADTANLPRGDRGFVLIGATMREFFPPQED